MNTKTNPNGHRVVAVWVRFGVQLGLRQTPALIKSAKNKKKRRTSVLLLLCVLRALNQCRCLPKAELNTKTNPNGHHSVAVWVRFGVQLDFSCRLKSVPSNGIKRVWLKNLAKCYLMIILEIGLDFGKWTIYY